MAATLINPFSSHSRDICLLIVLLINVILAAAQICNFLRLQSVTIQELGTLEQYKGPAVSFICTLAPAIVSGGPRGSLQLQPMTALTL